MTPAQAAALAVGGGAVLVGVVVVAALLASAPAPTSGRCAYSPAAPADSCRAAYDDCGVTNTSVWLRSSVPGEAPFPAWCDGGWALALIVDGTRDTFVYASPLWTNDTLLNDDPAAVPLLGEAKLRPFVSTAGTTIRLLMTVAASGGLTGSPVDLDVPGNFSSLRALFAAGDYVATAASLGYASCGWRGLTPGGSTYQPNCNRQGVNLQQYTEWGSWIRYRVGVIYNQENNCGSPDSAQGVGGEVTWNQGGRLVAQSPVAAGAWAPPGGFGQTFGTLYRGTVAGTMRVYVSSRAGPPPGGDCDPTRNATAAALAAYVAPVPPGPADSAAADGHVAAAVVVALAAAGAAVGAAVYFYHHPPPPPPVTMAAGAAGAAGVGLSRRGRASVGQLLPPPPGHSKHPVLSSGSSRASMLSLLMLPAASPGASGAAAASFSDSGSFFGDLFAPKAAAAPLVAVTAVEPDPAAATSSAAEAGEYLHGEETAAAAEAAAFDDDPVTPSEFAVANPMQAAMLAAAAAAGAGGAGRKPARTAGAAKAAKRGAPSSSELDSVTQDTVFTYVGGTRIARLNAVGVAGGVGNGFSPAAAKPLAASSRRLHRGGH